MFSPRIFYIKNCSLIPDALVRSEGQGNLWQIFFKKDCSRFDKFVVNESIFFLRKFWLFLLQFFLLPTITLWYSYNSYLLRYCIYRLASTCHHNLLLWGGERKSVSDYLGQIAYYESRTGNDGIFLSFCSKHAVLLTEPGERLGSTCHHNLLLWGGERKSVSDWLWKIAYYDSRTGNDGIFLSFCSKHAVYLMLCCTIPLLLQCLIN